MVLKHKAYKFRIYPTKEQEILIAKTIGCSRFIFNHFLAKWEEMYKTTGKRLSYGSCSKEIPLLKQEFDWLKEVDSTSVQISINILPMRLIASSRSRMNALVSSRSAIPSSRTKPTSKASLNFLKSRLCATSLNFQS